jgi:hypothetical protein
MAPLADGFLSTQIERRDLEIFQNLKLKLPISLHLMGFTARSSIWVVKDPSANGAISEREREREFNYSAGGAFVPKEP